MNLLIVNDEILTVETIRDNVSWNQHGVENVYMAYNVEGGKKCLTEYKIDILLLDIEMPGENGIALLRWVKENKMPVECIFLTCHASFDYAREAMMLGCQDYLLIPARYEEIGATVERVVNRILENRKAQQYQQYGRQVLQGKLDEAVKCHGEKKSPKELTQEAIDYIMCNLGSETLNVNEVAEKLYLHPVYLNRIFRKEKEQSIGHFIIEERMKLAGELLKSGKISAAAVAEQVGYLSYASFNLMFRRYYGCTPSQYQAGLKIV